MAQTVITVLFIVLALCGASVMVTLQVGRSYAQAQDVQRHWQWIRRYQAHLAERDAHYWQQWERHQQTIAQAKDWLSEASLHQRLTSASGRMARLHLMSDAHMNAPEPITNPRLVALRHLHYPPASISEPLRVAYAAARQSQQHRYEQQVHQQEQHSQQERDAS